jgi:hypothetical protein
MNEKPISQSKDRLLRGSLPALLRAARRARERAWQTNTRLVVSENGRLRYIEVKAARVAADRADYGPDA